MGVTSKLLRLNMVDRQIRGLRARLDSAENYLRQQDVLLDQLDEQVQSIATQLRQLEAQEHNDETEIAAIEERIATLRDRMNNAQTSKEHSAFLTEINTLKADKELIEERAIELLTKLDELRALKTDAQGEIDERRKVRDVAFAQRDERESEIKDRLEELKSERSEAEADVPGPALAVYDDRLESGAEDIMAPCEEQSRRNMEYTCGSCYTHLPMEQVNKLLTRGDLTTCPACNAILYMEEELRQSFGEKKKRTSSKKKTNDEKVAAELDAG